MTSSFGRAGIISSTPTTVTVSSATSAQSSSVVSAKKRIRRELQPVLNPGELENLWAKCVKDTQGIATNSMAKELYVNKESFYCKACKIKTAVRDSNKGNWTANVITASDKAAVATMESKHCNMLYRTGAQMVKAV